MGNRIDRDLYYEKNTKGILTLILVIALLFSGTLAWRDMNQHKTNKFTTTEIQNNVVLVEEFKEKMIGAKVKMKRRKSQFKTVKMMTRSTNILVAYVHVNFRYNKSGRMGVLG